MPTLLIALMLAQAPAAPPSATPASADAELDPVARYYPEPARTLKVEGKAEIGCEVDGRGLLSGCTVVAEDPPGYGFGEAALGMSRLFKMKPMTKSGQKVTSGKVRIPIRFKLPDDSDPASVAEEPKPPSSPPK